MRRRLYRISTTITMWSWEPQYRLCTQTNVKRSTQRPRQQRKIECRWVRFKCAVFMFCTLHSSMGESHPAMHCDIVMTIVCSRIGWIMKAGGGQQQQQQQRFVKLIALRCVSISFDGDKISSVLISDGVRRIDEHLCASQRLCWRFDLSFRWWKLSN